MTEFNAHMDAARSDTDAAFFALGTAALREREGRPRIARAYRHRAAKYFRQAAQVRREALRVAAYADRDV